MHHRLSTILLLAGLATERASAAIPNLTQCQSRCFNLTAQMVGCGKEDYACQCPIFNEQFIPQMQSCMIEGCAFDSEPLSEFSPQSQLGLLLRHAPNSHVGGADYTPVLRLTTSANQRSGRLHRIMFGPCVNIDLASFCVHASLC